MNIMESENDVPLISNARSQSPKKIYFLLEPAIFLVFFAINLSGTVFQTHLMQQTCVNVFKFNITDCNKLGTEEIESDISKNINLLTQPYVANIFMTRTILESVLPAIVTLYLGPWSDKYGRKPVILICLIGYLLGFTIVSVITLLSTFYIINPWYYIIASIPVSLTGGMCCLISSLFCYVADICRKENLAFRNVINEAAIFIGSMVGTLLSSYFLTLTSPLYVFITSANTILFAILYVIFCIRENVDVHDKSKMEMFSELFNFSLVKDMFSTCFERRANYDRLIIWLIMLSSIISIFIMEGNDTVIYLFVVQKFGWTIKEFTKFNGIGIANVTIGNILGVYLLQKVFKFSVVSLTLLGIASAVLDSVVKATASISWEMYLAMAFGTLRGIAGPMKRTLLSYIVPEHDLGKIMSFTVSFESLSALGAAPLYTLVYSATLQIYSGAFHFISAGLYLLCYIFIAVVYGIQKSDQASAYSAIN